MLICILHSQIKIFEREKRLPCTLTKSYFACRKDPRRYYRNSCVLSKDTCIFAIRAFPAEIGFFPEDWRKGPRSFMLVVRASSVDLGQCLYFYWSWGNKLYQCHFSWQSKPTEWKSSICWIKKSFWKLIFFNNALFFMKIFWVTMWIFYFNWYEIHLNFRKYPFINLNL